MTGEIVTQPQEFQFHGDAKAIAGPDGRVRVVLTFTCGNVHNSYVLEGEDADAFIDAVAKAVRDMSAAARRANAGLIVPAAGNGAVPLPVNAERLRRRPNVRPGP